MEAAHEQGPVTWTQVIFGLQALSLFTGVLGVATAIDLFVLACPSILAVGLNYMRRAGVRGTWLESHFRWQIRTFWYGLLWCSTLVPWTPDGTSVSSVLAGAFRALGPGLFALALFAALAVAMFIASLPLGVLPCRQYHQRQISPDQIWNVLTCAAVRILSLWFLYRITRGWVALNRRHPMYAP